MKDGSCQRIFPAERHPVIHFLIAFTGVLLLAYALLIFYYHWIWERIPSTPFPSPDPVPFSPQTKVSVIIPARNEAAQIGNCLDAIFKQSYPALLTEVIVVNDFSTDETASLVAAHAGQCRLLHLSDYVKGSFNSYKKKAIETGIQHSSGELILCTDADCIMGPEWILSLVENYEKNNFLFLAGPVKIFPASSPLAIFQALDFISLQGITGAAVYKSLYPMCNGANLAYTRRAFETVDGFSDIDHIASGDDMLLMKKIQSRFPGSCGYVKDPRAIVSTAPARSMKEFFNQRIRWASKISHYQHPPTFLTLALVYLLNLSLLILFFGCFFSGHWRWLLLLLAFKTISEYFFVSKVAAFFRQQSLTMYFFLCQPFHILYTVIAGSFGSFGRYEWKSRKVK